MEALFCNSVYFQQVLHNRKLLPLLASVHNVICLICDWRQQPKDLRFRCIDVDWDVQGRLVRSQMPAKILDQCVCIVSRDISTLSDHTPDKIGPEIGSASQPHHARQVMATEAIFDGELFAAVLWQKNAPISRTFEQRAIMYHDWGRVNLTFNFINETGLESGENDFGYAWGVFRQAAYMAMETDKNMAGMAGMPKKEAPPVFSFQRLGYGLEMIGALGNTDQFGFDWQRQQQYVGPVFS